jgi:hypothetical protein
MYLETLEQRTLMTIVGGFDVTLSVRKSMVNDMLSSHPLRTSLSGILSNTSLSESQKISQFDSHLLNYMRVGNSAYYYAASDIDSTYNDATTYHSSELTTLKTVADEFIFNEGSGGGAANELLVTHDDDYERANIFPSVSYARRYGYGRSGWSYATYETKLVNWWGWWAAHPSDTSIETYGIEWGGLDTAKRVENFVEAYHRVLSASGWSGAENTLFVYMIKKHGDRLYDFVDGSTNPLPYTNIPNQRASQAINLMLMSRVFSFYDDGASVNGRQPWRHRAQGWLDSFLNTSATNEERQYRADGVHVEQSPDYGVVTASQLTEAAWLAARQGSPFASSQTTALLEAYDAHHDMLSPHGDMTAMGDSLRKDRAGTMSYFVQPALALLPNSPATTRWPIARPNLDNMLMFWSKRAVSSNFSYNNPAPSALVPNRVDNNGRYTNLPNSGYYVVRSSGHDSQARQLTFDVGQFGSLSPKGHGHYDLLAFEMSAYGRPLVVEPGYYNIGDRGGTTAKQIARSTVGHNTISLRTGTGASGSLAHGAMLTTSGAYPEDTVNHPTSRYLRGSLVTSTTSPSSSGLLVKGVHNLYDIHNGSYGVDTTVARNVWFNQSNIFIIVDWVKQNGTTTSPAVTADVSFNFLNTTTTNSTTNQPLQQLAADRYRTTRQAGSNGGNVVIQTWLPSGHSLAEDDGSGTAPSPHADLAVRTVREDGKAGSTPVSRLIVSSPVGVNQLKVFVTTLITYEGTTVPSTTFSNVSVSSSSGSVTVTLSDGTTLTTTPLDLINRSMSTGEAPGYFNSPRPVTSIELSGVSAGLLAPASGNNPSRQSYWNSEMISDDESSVVC